MAKANNNIPPAPPLVELSKELRDHLEGMQADFDKADEYMDAMEEIGVDSSRLRAQVEQSKKMRDVILRVLT